MVLLKEIHFLECEGMEIHSDEEAIKVVVVDLDDLKIYFPNSLVLDSHNEVDLNSISVISYRVWVHDDHTKQDMRNLMNSKLKKKKKQILMSLKPLKYLFLNFSMIPLSM